jgi:hypothetical protein
MSHAGIRSLLKFWGVLLLIGAACAGEAELIWIFGPWALAWIMGAIVLAISVAVYLDGAKA